MATTTIQLSTHLKEIRVGMKIHPRETLNDVVERLVEDVQELDEVTQAEVGAARAETRAGRYLTQVQVRKAMGL